MYKYVSVEICFRWMIIYTRERERERDREKKERQRQAERVRETEKEKDISKCNGEMM